MTVNELIEKLQQQPADAIVTFKDLGSDECGECYIINHVEKRELFTSSDIRFNNEFSEFGTNYKTVKKGCVILSLNEF